MSKETYYPHRPNGLTRTWLVSFCFSLCSILSIQTVYAQLSGTYTIGGANGDYENFTEASQALEAEGIAGPVIFKINPGTYEEPLILGEIPGNSCDKPITFEGESSGEEDVVLAASGNALEVQGTDGLVFRNITIYQVHISGGSNCISLENNHILGLFNVISGPGTQANHHHSYRNNHFSGGIRKIKTGDFNQVNPDFDEGLEISGNSIGQYRGHALELSAQRDYFINNNQIIVDQVRDPVDAIHLTNSWYGKEIRGNTIEIRSFYGRSAAIRTENGFRSGYRRTGSAWGKQIMWRIPMGKMKLPWVVAPAS